MHLYLQLNKTTHTGSLLPLTSWHAVPGPSVGDAIFKAGVIVVLAAGGSVRVRHDWVVNGVGLCQRLKHHIIWTGTVLVGGTLEEASQQRERAMCLDSGRDKVLIEHLHLQHITRVPVQTHFVYSE